MQVIPVLGIGFRSKHRTEALAGANMKAAQEIESLAGLSVVRGKPNGRAGGIATGSSA